MNRASHTPHPELVGIALLAIDDISIPFTHNLRLEMHGPVKHPDNPLLRPGAPDMPDGYGAQFYGSIVQYG